jgi:hypothetical protein
VTRGCGTSRSALPFDREVLAELTVAELGPFQQVLPVAV